MDPRIAVVMITHNRRNEVLHSLEHLTCLPEQPQIVLVDNASTDDTLAAVAHRFPDVQIIAAGGNLGGAGRNLGVQQVNAPYIAFCDDDTWWEPGGLRYAADLMDAHPRLAVISAHVLVGPQEKEDPTCRIMAESPLARTPAMPGPALLGFLAGASVVRRAAFLAAGGFNDHFLVGGEEQLLATDLAAAGWWLCYIAAITVHHYPSQQRETHDTRRWRMVRNALWFAWLRRPLPSVLRRTFAVLRSALHNQTARQGFIHALAGLPWVLRQRRVVPPTVEAGLRQLDYLAK